MRVNVRVLQQMMDDRLIDDFENKCLNFIEFMRSLDETYNFDRVVTQTSLELYLRSYYNEAVSERDMMIVDKQLTDLINFFINTQIH